MPCFQHKWTLEVDLLTNEGAKDSTNLYPIVSPLASKHNLSCDRAPKWLFCIFRNKLLNIKQTISDFLELHAYLFGQKPLAAHMLLGPVIIAARERES